MKTSPSSGINFNGVIDTSFGDSTLDPGRVMTDFRPIYDTDGEFVARSNIIFCRTPSSPMGRSWSPDGLIPPVGRKTCPRPHNPNGVIDTSLGDNTLQPGRVLTDFRALPMVSAVMIESMFSRSSPTERSWRAGHLARPTEIRTSPSSAYSPNGIIEANSSSTPMAAGYSPTLSPPGWQAQL